MGRVRFAPEQIIGKLREAELLLGQGTDMGEAVRQLGISRPPGYDSDELALLCALQARQPLPSILDFGLAGTLPCYSSLLSRTSNNDIGCLGSPSMNLSVCSSGLNNLTR